MTPAQLAILLQELKGFQRPRAKEEQYTTPSDIAANVVHHAAMLGDITGKTVIDLGAGTGLLGLACAYLGAREVILVEQDADALEVTHQNSEHVLLWFKREGFTTPRITLIHQPIGDVTHKSETIVMNPPFGTKKTHADRPFLEKAFESAPVVYTFTKKTTAPFVRNYAQSFGFSATHAWPYQFPLAKTFSFHQKPRRMVDTVVLRFKSEIKL